MLFFSLQSLFLRFALFRLSRRACFRGPPPLSLFLPAPFASCSTWRGVFSCFGFVIATAVFRPAFPLKDLVSSWLSRSHRLSFGVDVFFFPYFKAPENGFATAAAFFCLCFSFCSSQILFPSSSCFFSLLSAVEDP